MDHANQRAMELVSRMTLEEKASLLSGRNFWHLKGVERLGLEGVMVADGPHGLRKQPEETDHLGLNKSVPATCFPTASATACSFDRGLMREIGRAIGEECREQNVAVILGPGLNIKRSPLCGRNFEYVSEDPYLTGELAAAYVEGVQGEGVGVSLKHFALNNQERRRMTSESVCDERAFREIYLAGFERAVKQAKPWTVMCSYNRLYGEYACESKLLLNDILRDEWGFEGIVMTDWGAMNERVRAVSAGCDLEMPGVSDANDRLVVKAVREGKLSEADVDRCAARLVALMLKAKERAPLSGTKQAHHALARRAEAESAVLLKNEGGLLPGKPAQSAAVIGAFAKTPRYQGAGSSKINPTRVDCACDELAALGLAFDYAPGYGLAADAPDEALIQEACEAAKGKDIVYLFAGLPDRYESEGFDREKLTLPASHAALIERVREANPNLAVILSGGSVMDLSWEASAKAILLGGLGGQAGAGALAEILLGRVNPSGKLAESWCEKLEDNPSYGYFPGSTKSVEYRESIYVGYRYYDTAKKSVRYPFGHGLSYTQFEYSNLRVEKGEGNSFTVRADVRNTGARDGAEIVQLYVAPPESAVYKAEQELRGFEKLFLRAGETGTAAFALASRDFAYWDANQHAWRVDAGEYELRVSASSRDARLRAFVRVEAENAESPAPDFRASAPCYYDLSNGIGNVPDASFEAVYGGRPPARERAPGEAFTQNSTLVDIREKALGRALAKMIVRKAGEMTGDDEDERLMMEGMIREAPLRMLLMAGGDVTPGHLEGIVELLNGRFFKGLGKVLKG